MSEYEIATLALQQDSLTVQKYIAGATIFSAIIAGVAAYILRSGIKEMVRASDKRSETIVEQTKEQRCADERRHEEAMAAHRETMEALKATHEESMTAFKAAHEESMTALKALIGRTDPGPTAPTGAD